MTNPKTRSAPTDLTTRLRAFLSENTTFTIATVSDMGAPHACDLFYAHGDDLTLYFLSDPKTRHVQNLMLGRHVSVTIHGQSRGWEDIRGIQLEGTAVRVEDAAERARGFALYIAKYGFVKQWLTSASVLGSLLKGLGVVELYKITPDWMRLIDNSLGFGHKEEWSRPASP